MSHPTAILLFSRTARAEARAKAFGSRGERVAEALIGRTRRTLARTGLPVYHHEGSDEDGTDFGRRLVGAVKAVFARGYESVIIVGNDCPSLRAGDILAGARALGRGSCVIGADRRGGAWLVGLRREGFDADTLAGLAWQTEGLAGELRAYLGTARELRTAGDINFLSDLQRGWPRFRRLLAGLADLVARPILIAHFRAPHSGRRPTEDFSRRGPPLFG